MMRAIAVAALFLLGACSSAAPPAAPANAVSPEIIDYFDITRNKLYGSGCNFAADGGGMGALVLGQAEQAVMQLDGKIVKIAADKTSKPLRQGSWSRYADSAYVLRFVPIKNGKNSVNGVVESLDVHISLTDPAGKALYAAKGQVQCKPM